MPPGENQLEPWYLFIAAIALRQWPSSAPDLAQVTNYNEGGVWDPLPTRGTVIRK